jgi:hypothetical protein
MIFTEYKVITIFQVTKMMTLHHKVDEMPPKVDKSSKKILGIFR